METALILISLVFGAYAGWRMLGRAARVVWARCVSNVFVQSAWAWVVAWGAQPEPSEGWDDAPSEEPSLAQDGAASAIRDATPGGRVELTSVELVRELARVKKVDSDGVATWLSKDRIAALVGMRAVDARAIIDEVRGTDPAPKPAAPTTPYAGRPYNPASYHDDSDLEFRAPPQEAKAV